MSPSADLFSYDDMPSIGPQSIPPSLDPLIIHHEQQHVQQQQHHEDVVAQHELDDWLQSFSFDAAAATIPEIGNHGAATSDGSVLHSSINLASSPSSENSIANKMKTLGEEQKATILKKIDDRIARLEEVKRRILSYQKDQVAPEHIPSTVSDSEESASVSGESDADSTAIPAATPSKITSKKSSSSKKKRKRAVDEDTVSAIASTKSGNESDGSADIEQQKLQRR